MTAIQDNSKIVDGRPDMCESTKSSRDIGTDYTFKRKIVWFNAIGFLLLNLAALYGIYLFRYAHRYTILWGKLKKNYIYFLVKTFFEQKVVNCNSNINKCRHRQHL